ncbi:hypothetical protein QBC42DRAFT_259919 [Cladorrhinum samala]|uniref:Uncharacterized protein n=1 Tax=Cladorrhinum samala TaxID=585594 RepID=A0AAV9HZC2_9PEZI|nr:hypothetical protein QBC42DRAFT_259919 [Cladorrhinum samala]
MCTYSFTPYVGCKGGQQHYYLQWMKCSNALENGDKFCPMDQSVESDALRQLSRNVLSCPIHTPIVVQQHMFEFAQAENVPPTPRSRARRGNMTPKTRTPKSGTFGRFEEQVPRRKRASTRDHSPASSIDIDSDSDAARPKTSDGVKRPEREDRGRSTGLRDKPHHRRVNSADLEMLPARASTTRQSQRKTERPSRPQKEAPEQTEQATKEEVSEEKPKGKSPKITHTLDIPSAGPVGIGITGLPYSPDIYRRPSSTELTKTDESAKSEPENKAETAVSPVALLACNSNTGSDSSPVQQTEPLPFSSSLASRRGRRVARSLRMSSEESPMTRIDEHDGQEPVHELPRSGSRPVSRSSTSRVPSRRGTPHLSQDAFIPPVPPLSPGLHTPRGFGEFPPLSPRSFRTTFSYEGSGDASSVKSGRSRKGYEEQVADAKKWVEARGSMPINHGGSGNITDLVMQNPRKMSEPNLVAGRDSSIDSGYKSGQGNLQRRGSEAAVETDAAKLQKTMSASGLSQAHRPPPLQLVGAHAGRLPPCALPVSLYSPAVVQGTPQAAAAAAAAAAAEQEQAKKPLLQKMGLRKKISGLVGKGRSKEVGVGG